MQKPGRRILSITGLPDVIVEAQRIRESGYRKLGQWDLSQTCHHLAVWMSYPMTGFLGLLLYFDHCVALVRTMFGRAMLNKKTLASGRMPAGTPTTPDSLPSAGRDESQAIVDLSRAVQRLIEFEGPLDPSPLFGELSRDE